MEQKQFVDTTMKLETTQPKTNIDEEIQRHIERREDDEFEYSKQAQWLRTVILETNDGLLSTASLMMGVGVLNQHHVKDIVILCGLAGILIGALITAMGEFRSVNCQRRDVHKGFVHPLHVAISLAFAFTMGGMIPLMVGLSIQGYIVRVGAMAGAMCVGFAVFGWLGAFLGGASWFRAGLRVLLFCWVAMTITLGLVVPQW